MSFKLAIVKNPFSRVTCTIFISEVVIFLDTIFNLFIPFKITIIKLNSTVILTGDSSTIVFRPIIYETAIVGYECSSIGHTYSSTIIQGFIFSQYTVVQCHLSFSNFDSTTTGCCMPFFECYVSECDF